MSALGLAGEGLEGSPDTLRVGAGGSAGPATRAASSGNLGSPSAASPSAVTPSSTKNTLSYQAQWGQIANAATLDAAALEALDIEWIDSLDDRLLKQIDAHFSETSETKAFHALVEGDPRVKAARQGFEKESEKAKTEANARHRTSGGRGNREAYRQDEAYQEALRRLHASRDQDIGEVHQELRPQFDAQRHPYGLGDTIVEPPAAGVTRKEGKTLARVNFVAWGFDIFGSVAAFKAHFLGMRRVAGPSSAGSTSLWMCSPAATRYEQARSWFENQYPGNTFFSTAVGQSMRNLHRHDSPLGYLGHALGFSVDFAAYENPNQDDPVAQFMLRTFGGTRGEQGERIHGDNNLDMPGGKTDSKIRAMGAASAAGEELPAGSDRYLEEVGAAFDEMAATSDRFQASLQAELPALRAAKRIWATEAGPRNAVLASTERKLTTARATAKKKLQRGARDAVTAEMVDQDAAVAALIHQRDVQKAELKPHLDSVLSTMKSVFAPWVEELQTDVDKREQITSKEDRALAISPQDADDALNKVKNAKSQRELTALLADKRYRVAFASIDPTSFASPAELKDVMQRRAAQVRQARWDAGEIASRLEIIRRLSSDPRSVFGSIKAVGKSWENPDQVVQPSVVQYMERGFVKHDELASAAPDEKDKGVFNREFVMAMMRWGFSTGASWNKADTMHFDFEDGFGMIQGNRGTKFGPKG